MDCTTTSVVGQRKRRAKPKSEQVGISEIAVCLLRESPENEKLYRPITEDDPETIAMAASITANGILDPLVVTKDRYVVSGHRRLLAAKMAGLTRVPCRRESFRRCDDQDRFVRLLREHNRQRVKTLDETIRERVLDVDPEAAYQSLIDHRRRSSRVEIPTISIRGESRRAKISAAKIPFLNAVQAVLEKYNNHLPLTTRAIHYRLLNAPPLIHASKPGSTYRNDRSSYAALSDLLTRARIDGSIPFEAIHDPTRPMVTWQVHQGISSYLPMQLDSFAKSYWRDLMQSQPNHIEIVGEKITVEPIVKRVAMRYCIPYCIGRGFCSLPPRHEMAERFRKSGKERLVVLVVSDFDPAGEEIAHSYARSMRDDFDMNKIEPVKVALTWDQVQEHELPPGGKAKRGTGFKRFVDRYGDDVWELEALEPNVLEDILAEAVDSVIDVDAFNQELDQERRDAVELAGVRAVVLESLMGYRGGQIQ